MKIVCIYHSRDLDGWMSAAIVKHWYLTKVIPNDDSIGELVLEPTIKEYVPKKPISKDTNNLWFIGYDYGQPIPDVSDYDKVIMVDISFPKDTMLELNLRLGTNFIWIDHHQRTIDEVNDYIIKNGIPMEGSVTESGELKAACELTWKYFYTDDKMPEIVRLLGRYDCFGHVGTDEHKKALEFQYGAREVIHNYEEAYFYLNSHIEANKGSMLSFDNSIEGIHTKGKAIYAYVCSEAKQLYAKSFPIELGREEDLEKTTFLCVNAERFNPMNFDIDYHKEGYEGFACFWMMKDKQWQFSFYNADGTVDCSMIAKSFGGGGHKGAAGAIVDNDTLYRIITNR